MDGGGEVMIRLESSYSGAQLGCAVGNDPEELSYALKELTDFDAADLGEEVSLFLGAGDANLVAKYLHEFAEAIFPTEDM
jgi:hypothetical protein